MKVHRPLVNGVVHIVTAVVEGGHPTDRAIERVFKSNPKWGARDRRFVAESVYECIRWWRKLDEVTQRSGAGPTIADRVTVYGKLHDWEEAKEKPLLIDPKELWEEIDRQKNAVSHALPDWLHELGRKEVGDRWSQEMKVLNEVAPVDLRVNAIKSQRSNVIAKLREDEVEASELDGFPDGITLKERKNIFSTEAFKAGLFEVQDRSSQKIARFLDPQPGERVIDACAGAGGKSLHIAALMKNKGRVIALDIHDRKLEELRKRARRAGAGTIETRLIDSTKVIKRLAGSADRVLLDVPCTGMGVLRRNPDTKLRLQPEDVERINATQAEILQSYSTLVKPGGTLVYSTCSILPSENSKQVENFCSQNQTYVLDEQWTVWPSERNGDGFFAARLRRQ